MEDGAVEGAAAGAERVHLIGRCSPALCAHVALVTVQLGLACACLGGAPTPAPSHAHAHAASAPTLPRPPRCLRARTC
eukprot:5909235-Prymnesium_polylepis.1